MGPFFVSGSKKVACPWYRECYCPGHIPGVLFSRSLSGSVIVPVTFRECFSPGHFPGKLFSRSLSGSAFLPVTFRECFSPGHIPGVLFSRSHSGSAFLPVRYRDNNTPGTSPHPQSPPPPLPTSYTQCNLGHTSCLPSLVQRRNYVC